MLIHENRAKGHEYATSPRETHQKVNITWNDNNTVSYRQTKRWFFDQDRSNGSLQDNVTTLNVVAVVSTGLYRASYLYRALPDILPVLALPGILPVWPLPDILPVWPLPDILPMLPLPGILPVWPLPDILPVLPLPDILPVWPLPDILPVWPLPGILPVLHLPDILPVLPLPDILPVWPLPGILPVLPLPGILPVWPLPGILPVWHLPGILPVWPLPDILPVLPLPGILPVLHLPDILPVWPLPDILPVWPLPGILPVWPLPGILPVWPLPGILPVLAHIGEHVTAGFVARDWGYFMQKSISLSFSSIGQKIAITKMVGQLLFDGFEDPIINMGSAFPLPNTLQIPYDKFGWFYQSKAVTLRPALAPLTWPCLIRQRNGSYLYDGLFNIDTGQGDIGHVGELKNWNYRNTTEFYQGTCARIDGTAGELWPPKRGREDRVTMYSTDLCRSPSYARYRSSTYARYRSPSYARYRYSTYARYKSTSYARYRFSSYARYRSFTYARYRSFTYARYRSTSYARYRSPSYARYRSSTYARYRSPSYARYKSTSYARYRSTSYARYRSSTYARYMSTSYARYRSSTYAHYRCTSYARYRFPSYACYRSPSYARYRSPFYARYMSHHYALFRSISFDYTDEYEVEGILGYRYSGGPDIVDNGTLDPTNECFCGGECVPSGVLNVSSCRFGAPAFISYPHFYQADQVYLDQVEGMEPDEEKHRFYVTLEPNTGIPLDVAARFQVNILLDQRPYISLFKNVPKIFFPMLWFEERAAMPQEMASQLKLLLHLPTIGLVVSITLVLVGLFTASTTALCCVCRSVNPPLDDRLDKTHLAQVVTEVALRISHSSLISSERMKPREEVHPTEIQTSISPSSAVELNTTSALANYATEAGVEPGSSDLERQCSSPRVHSPFSGSFSTESVTDV
uniref:Uncharacterized protein n=1 Tax=Timema shepardi TaxID=629360 RepID=A0A7R9B223_TIMSH|nr:unnamed protein product [Timema shepardi]